MSEARHNFKQSSKQSFNHSVKCALKIALVIACLTPTISACTNSSANTTTLPSELITETVRPIVIASSDFKLPIADRPNSKLPVTVESADKKTVTITDTSRIIVLNDAIAEIVISLGFLTNIIGRDATTTIEALKPIPKVSSGHDVSAESVLALSPTLVIGDTRSGPPEAIQQLRGAGVSILLAPEVWQLKEIAPRITLIAKALGVIESGDKLLDETQSKIDQALAQSTAKKINPRVAFIYLRGTASVFLLGGEGSGADEMIQAAGGIDVGTDLGLASFTPLTTEAIVKANPDIIIVLSLGLKSVGGIDGLLALPGIAQTPATKTRAVISIDDDLLFSFGPRTGSLIVRLAQSFDTLMTATN
jgi:iron complex transport system substrate-binding protein